MSPKMKSKELSKFFLLVFVSQLFLVTLVSFSLDSTIATIDTELTSDGDFSDELDADEGDFSILIEEELEKEYFGTEEFIIPFNAKRSNFFYHKNDHSSFIDFKNHQPPEVIN
jgi:hypothetical protein